MAELIKNIPSEVFADVFEADFPSTEARLAEAYTDPIVHDRGSEIMRSAAAERFGLLAQLITYLAAAYQLFPEESQVVRDSLTRQKNG